MHENMVYFGDRKLRAQFWSLSVKKKRDGFSGLSLKYRDSTFWSHATGLVSSVKMHNRTLHIYIYQLICMWLFGHIR